MKGIRMLALLLAVTALAVALGLSKFVRSTAALAKAGTVSAAPVEDETDFCQGIPPESISFDPNGERTTSFRDSTCERFQNPCTGGFDVFLVDKHVVTHSRIDSNGGTHIRSHIEEHGTSLTPAEYGQCTSGQISRARTSTRAGGDGVAYIKTGAGDSVFNFVKNSGYNSSGPPPENFDDPLNLHVISKGGGPNYTQHQTLHITVNANNVVTACVTNERSTCQGGGGGGGGGGNTNAGQ